MNDLTTDAAWVLLAAFTLSLGYELYRATAKAGTSRHDSVRTLVMQGLPIYVVAAAVIVTLFAGWGGAAWLGLSLAVAGILVSTFYYNPRVLPERRPDLIDWVEDIIFSGLLFAAATILLYELVSRF